MSYPVLIAGSNYVKVDVRNMGNNFGPPDNMPVFYQGPAYSGKNSRGSKEEDFVHAEKRYPETLILRTLTSGFVPLDLQIQKLESL